MQYTSKRMQFRQCVKDLIDTESVQSMKDISHHVNVSCLDHSIFVAYVSFLICRKLRLDFKAAARGGLLHDLFLYDWKDKESHEGWHGMTHPKTALRNASELCALSEKEQDIIVKHMWPLTSKAPKFKEAFVVSIADKLCAIAEMLMIYHVFKIKRRITIRSYQPSGQAG